MSTDKKLKILILGLNYAPEMVGIAVYTTGLAEALIGRGHQVCVVVGKPYYPTWTLPTNYKGGWWRRTAENGVDVTRVSHYIPSNPTGTRRIIHHATFAISSFIPTLLRAREQRPDIVLTIAPSLIAAPLARLSALICGAKTWLHIQDFEVEAAMATGLIKRNGIVARAARLFEQKVISWFDQVSSISPAMCRKLVEKGIPEERVFEFRNWADIDAIKPLDRPSIYREEWGITATYVALYSGNIANKQGIEVVVEAARHLRYRKDLVFVVCGEGPNRKALEAQSAGLDNILFRDLQPKEKLSELLGLATVHLLPQIAGAADLVLPSKLTNILASGRPVIAAAYSGTALADEVDGCGCVVIPEDAHALAVAIHMVTTSNDIRVNYANCARERATQRWDLAVIVYRLERKLFELIA